MKDLLKNGREAKGLKTREVAALLNIDQALISKFENGLRLPTKLQIIQLANLFEIELKPLQIAWLKQRILREINDEDFALEAIKQVEIAIGGQPQQIPDGATASFQKLMDEMENLKSMLGKG